MKTKHPEESLTVMTEIVLPNESNNLGNLFGGQLLSWMDRCSAISANRHCKMQVVTAAVNNVSFSKPIPMASVVTLEAKVSRAFKSSMEVFVDVYVEDQRGSETRIHTNEAIYTFVAVNDEGRPAPIPTLVPQTDIEKLRFKGALRRKQLGLILSGKMEPEDATELKALFF